MRVQAALRAMSDEETRDQIGWRPGQKRTVKMATPEEALAHPAAQGRVSTPPASNPQSATTAPLPPELLQQAPIVAAEDALDKSTGVGVTAPTNLPPLVAASPWRRLAVALGILSGGGLGLVAVAFLVPWISGFITTPEATAKPAAPLTVAPSVEEPQAPASAPSAADTSTSSSAPDPSSSPSAETRPKDTAPATTVVTPGPAAPRTHSPQPPHPRPAIPLFDDLKD